MSRHEEYQNLIDAKILQGVPWSVTLEMRYDADESKYYLNASYNDLKALVDSDARVILHVVEENAGDVADIYSILYVIYSQPSTTPPVYGAYFNGGYELDFEAPTPDEELFFQS